MFHLHFCNFSHLSYLLALSLVFPLVGCSGGDGGSSSSSPSLSWAAPSEREDGAALNLSEIGGYRIYYGTEAGVYSDSIDVNDPTATDFTVQGILPAGDYFVVMTTIDYNGRESLWSAPELQVSF